MIRELNPHFLRQVTPTNIGLRQGSRNEGLILFNLHAPQDDLMTTFRIQNRFTVPSAQYHQIIRYTLNCR